MVVTFGLHLANRYPGSCDLKATFHEQNIRAVGQIGLSRPVISVTRADIRGFTPLGAKYARAVGQIGLSWSVIPVSRAEHPCGWADRDAMSCAARMYCEFDGFLCLEWVFWLYGGSRGSGTHIEKASWVRGKLLRPSAHNPGKNRKKAL